MRIAYVVTALGTGGAEMQVVLIAREMHRRGMQVVVCRLLNEPNDLEPRLTEENIECVTFGISGWRNIFQAALAACRWIRLWKPDVIHSHMFHANILCRLLRVATPIPRLVCSAHNSTEHSFIRHLAYIMTDRLADLTTNVSPNAVAAYTARRLCHPSRITYVPQSIDTDRFKIDVLTRQRVRNRLGLHGEFVFMAVGRLVPVKGFDILLEAFSAVLLICPKCRLYIVGGGPEYELLQRMISDLRMLDTVTLLGTRDDVPDLMNAADCLVISSYSEGGPMVLLEALACCKVVVSTHVGIATSLRNAAIITVPPGNHAKLAEGMLHASTLPRGGALNQKYAKLGGQHATAADLWLAIYRNDENVLVAPNIPF